MSETERLAEAALDAACLAIQDHMGVTDGLLASLFFSGHTLETMLDIFKQYIEAERNNK
jgi:hypothetical protein